MKEQRRTIWRVPVVLTVTGVLCRILSYLLAFAWGSIQSALNRDVLSTGYVTEIVSIAAFLLFWAAGWRFVRGLTRREIFYSATIMVVWHALLLAAEQFFLAMGSYPMLIYRLWATVESTQWLDQLLIHLLGRVTVPVMIPGLFVPYLYLVFGEKRPAASETDNPT